MTILVFGAGGHARSLLEVLRVTGRLWDVVACVAGEPQDKAARMYGVRVVGPETELRNIAGQADHFLLGVGRAALRRKLAEAAVGCCLRPMMLSWPGAYLSDFARWGVGLQVLAGASINAGARIGDHCILNTGAIVEHDCLIGDFVHVAPGAVLCGGVTVGDGAHVGANAVVREGLRIGAGAVVGCGAVVVKDVPAGEIWVGNPAGKKGEQHG